MNRLLILTIFFLTATISHSQSGFLFIKKGFRKKKIYTEGEQVYLRLHNDSLYGGMITRLINDTIFVTGRPVSLKKVKEVIVKKKENKSFGISTKNLLFITGGVALVSGGLTLSGQADFNEALTAGLVIGYVPLLVGYAKNKISFRRKRYKIGKKFRLQLLDFYLPRK